MGNLFGKQVPLSELIKQNKRMVNRAIRELDRERRRLETEEKKLIADIKKMAQAGQMGAVKIQAKELVRTRNYITKFIQLRAHLNAVSLKIQTVKSHEAMASAMRSTTAAMTKMNQKFNLPELQRIMMEFQRENEKAEMTMEVMGENLDDVMEEEGDEEEQEAIVNQVLDEIGVNFTEQIPDAPSEAPAAEETAAAAPEAVGATADPAVSDLEARLNNLRRD